MKHNWQKSVTAETRVSLYYFCFHAYLKISIIMFLVFELYYFLSKENSDELNNVLRIILLCPFVTVTITIIICCYFNNKICLFWSINKLNIVSHVLLNSFNQSRKLLTTFKSGQSIRRSLAGGPEISCTRIRSENSRQVKQRCLFPGGPGVNLMPLTLILCVFS